MNAIDFTLMAKAGTQPVSFRNGETIFREGDAADFLYVIQEGDVEVRLGNRALGTLNHGSIFGEMGLIDGSPRSATAVAASDVTLIPINEKQFLFMVSHTPYIALNVMRVLADRLRHMNQVL